MAEIRFGQIGRLKKDKIQEWWGCTRSCFCKYSANSLEAFYENMKSIFYLA